MLCYNFGVDSFQHARYEESVNWLRESFEIGKIQNTVEPKNQVELTLFRRINSHISWMKR